MPIVQISILPQSAEKKAEISKAITYELHRITGIRKEAMIVLFHELTGCSLYTRDVFIAPAICGVILRRAKLLSRLVSSWRSEESPDFYRTIVINIS